MTRDSEQTMERHLGSEFEEHRKTACSCGEN